MKQDQGHVGDFELEGIYAGLWAGALLLACEMLLAAALVPNGGFSTPLVLAASLIMGEHALQAPLLLAMPTGLLVHAGLSLGIGFLYGLVATAERMPTHRRRDVQVAIGALFGTVIWLLNFVLIARNFYPWVWDTTPAWTQLVLHVAAFGAPMGLIFTYLDDKRGGTSLSREAH